MSISITRRQAAHRGAKANPAKVPMMAVNANKPDRWKQGIAQPVNMYNDSFPRFAPKTWQTTRVDMKGTKSVFARTGNETCRYQHHVKNFSTLLRLTLNVLPDMLGQCRHKRPEMRLLRGTPKGWRPSTKHREQTCNRSVCQMMGLPKSKGAPPGKRKVE